MSGRMPRVIRQMRPLHILILLTIVICIRQLRTSIAIKHENVNRLPKTFQELNDTLTKSEPPVEKRLRGELPTPITVSSEGTYANTSLYPDFIYTLENPSFCSLTPDLKVLVMIHSAPSHVENRQAIRNTWTNSSYFPLLGMKTLFLLGQVKNLSHQDNLQREFNRYGDILQGDFIDDYHNMTYKAIMGYKWLTERCRNVKVILKTDDDIVINTFKFIKDILPRFLTTTRQITCHRGINRRIHRGEKSKWYVPPDVLKGRIINPDFCFGVMVVVSNDIVPEMYQASLTTEYLWTDDVFMYGFVAGKVKCIQYNSLKFGSEVIYGAVKPLRCYRGKNKNCPYLAIMPRLDVVRTMRTLWNLILNEQTK